MAGPAQKQDEGPEAKGAGARLLDLFFQALPAIGGAVGFAGFLAALGAAIAWVRFHAAGLPAAQAVSAIDKSELVVTGALLLAVFVVLGLVAVLVAIFLDRRGDGSTALAVGLCVLAAAELGATIGYLDLSTWQTVAAVAALLAVLVAALVTVAAWVPWMRANRALRDAADARDEAAPLNQAVAEAEREARGAFQPVSRRYRSRAGRRVERAVESMPVERALTSLDFVAGPGGPPLFAAAVVIAAAAGGMAFGHRLHWVSEMLLLVVVLNAGVFGVAFATRRLVWMGIAVFLSLPFFGAALEAVRTNRDPKLLPVALLRKSSDRAVCGLYITETKDRVYLGRVELRHKTDDVVAGTGRIFWIPDDDVDMIKIGSPQPIRQANGRAPELANELYNDRREEAPAKLAPTSTVTVTKQGADSTTTTTTQAPPDEQVPKTPVTPNPLPPTCTDTSLVKPVPAAEDGGPPNP